MTPEEYYKKEFKKDYESVKDVREKPLYTFDSLVQFAELYHYNELTKLNQDEKTNT